MRLTLLSKQSFLVFSRPILFLLCFLPCIPLFGQQEQEQQFSKAEIKDVYAQELEALGGYELEIENEELNKSIRKKRNRERIGSLITGIQRVPDLLNSNPVEGERELNRLLELAKKFKLTEFVDAALLNHFQKRTSTAFNPGIQNVSPPSWLTTKTLLGLKDNTLEGSNWQNLEIVEKNLETQMLWHSQSGDSASYSTEPVPSSDNSLTRALTPIIRPYQPDPDLYEDNRGVIRVNATNYTLKGFAFSYEGLKQFTINGQPVGVYASDGLWRHSVSLLTGQNEFFLEAISHSGLVARDTIRLLFEDDQVVQNDKPTRYLLSIAVEKYGYRGLSPLESPINDARAFTQLLQKQYGFVVSDTLYDAIADLENVKSALRKLIVTARPQDEVVIYFAGHGIYEDVFEEGYWMLFDAPFGNHAQLTAFNKIRALKLLVIADACFAGSMTQTVPTKPDDWPKDRARWLLSSGRIELVKDLVPGEQHSPFAFLLLDYLANLTSPSDAYEIEKYLKLEIPKYANQTPLARPLFGDNGGEWVFIPID